MAVSQANRGKSFETLIEAANKQYAAKNWAHIQKVATPWTVIRKGKQIVSAFPAQKSTIDFVGISNGKFIAFDAKSTKEMKRFPLSNVEPHQVEYLKKVADHGGLAFLLIEYANLGEIYLLPYKDLQRYIDRAEAGGRKSIEYSDMVCFQQVQSGRGIALDYLKGLI